MAQSSGEIGHATGRPKGTSTDDAATAPTSDKLRSHIEQTRAEMGDTIDAIQARLSPGRLVTDAKETVTEATVGRVKRLVHTVTRDRGHIGDVRFTVGDMLQTARNNPIPVAVAGLAATVAMLRTLKRSRNHTDEGLKNSATGSTVRGRRQSSGIGHNKRRMLAGACAGLACWGAFRARRSTTTFRAPADTGLIADN